jgi:hypothetical protein
MYMPNGHNKTKGCGTRFNKVISKYFSDQIAELKCNVI